MMYSAYMEYLIGKIFKILPLKEEVLAEDFAAYCDSLWIEMSGAIKAFPELDNDPRYISVLNIVGYLTMNEVDLPRCRREVFQAIDIVNKIRNGGGVDE